MKYREPKMEIVEFDERILTSLEIASQPTGNGSGGGTGGESDMPI